MASLRPFEQKLARGWPSHQWEDMTVLIGVSGGADSVALARAMHVLKSQGGGRLVAAHFNHRLRGDDSQADQRFVQSLCEALRIDLRIAQAPEAPSRSTPDGREEAARAARYEFLQKTAQALGARYVVTAHTADDQAETILHHVLRGTGLRGLSGINRARPLGAAATLVRPMLDVTRRDVLDYLASLDQSFRDDKTNLDTRYTRNRIRHELLPMLRRDFAPSVVESLVRLGALAADAQRVIDDVTQRLLGRCTLHCEASNITINCRELAGQDPHLVRELMIALWRRQAWPLQAMGFTQWSLLAAMALAENASRDAGNLKQIFPGAIEAQRKGEQLVLASVDGSKQF